GDGRVGSGVPGGRAHDDGGGAQAPGAGAGVETVERPARRVHREVPRRAGAGRGDAARGARRRAQRAVHRAAGAASAGALTVSRRPRTPSRALTTFAVGFLLLDGVLLAYSGLVLHRTMLVVWGGACIVAAGLVVLGWRRYRRALAELERPGGSCGTRRSRFAISCTASTCRTEWADRPFPSFITPPVGCTIPVRVIPSAPSGSTPCSARCRRRTWPRTWAGTRRDQRPGSSSNGCTRRSTCRDWSGWRTLVVGRSMRTR